jgi:hypothetical protein
MKDPIIFTSPNSSRLGYCILTSRITNHIDFPNHTPEQFLQIAQIMLAEQQYQITNEGEKVLLDYIKLRKT